MRRLAAVLAGLAMVAVACSSGGGSKSTSGGSAAVTTPGGGSGGSAAADLTDAFTTTSKGSGTLTFSLFGSAADFDTVSQSTSSAKDRALADKLIPTSSVVLAFAHGKSGSFELTLNLGGDQKAFDLLVVGNTLYARVDLKGIGSATGADTSKLSSQAASVEALIPGLGDLLAGKYVSLDLKQLSEMVKGLATGTPGSATSAPPTSLSGAQVDKIISAVQSALLSNSTVTKVGSDSVGTHYQASLQPRGFVQAILPQLQAMIPAAAAAGLGKVDSSVNQIPNTPVTVDVWVSGKKLKQLELDVRQFQKTGTKPANPVGVRLAFSGEASISAPSGATPIDLSKISSMIGPLLGNLSKGATG